MLTQPLCTGKLFLFGAAVVWFVGMFGLFLSAAFSDPGILPSNETRVDLGRQFANFDAIYIYTVEEENHSQTIFHRSLTNDVANIGKVCSTCLISRPPLSGHCKTCGHCVSIFDHHCNFIGNCVGQRNHRVFILWTWSCTALAIYQLCISLSLVLFYVFQEQEEQEDRNDFSLEAACLLAAIDLVGIAFILPISIAQCEHLYAGQTVKMRHKQGRISHFDDELLTCSGRSKRLFVNIKTFLGSYGPRPSLLCSDDIQKLEQSMLNTRSV